MSLNDLIQYTFIPASIAVVGAGNIKYELSAIKYTGFAVL